MKSVCVAGAGGISTVHVPAWREMEGFQLTAVCDIRPEMMDKYPDLTHYTDIDQMLISEKPDVLDICLPTPLHVDVAVKAMDMGIHVITEKPIALRPDQVDRAFEAARRNNVKFMVAQCVRFFPEFQFLKEIIDSGRYGKLLSGTMSRLGTRPKWSWDNWMLDETRSGLVPYDVHIHDLDFLIYALGKPNRADVHRKKTSDQEYLHVVYEYDDFFIAVDSSWYAVPFRFSQRFRFQFEDALLTMENGTLTVNQRDGQIIDCSAGDAEDSAFNLPKTNAYAAELRYFADCVLQDRPQTMIKEEELRTAVEILNTLV